MAAWFEELFLSSDNEDDTDGDNRNKEHECHACDSPVSKKINSPIQKQPALPKKIVLSSTNLRHDLNVENGTTIINKPADVKSGRINRPPKSKSTTEVAAPAEKSSIGQSLPKNLSKCGRPASSQTKITNAKSRKIQHSPGSSNPREQTNSKKPANKKTTHFQVKFTQPGLLGVKCATMSNVGLSFCVDNIFFDPFS